MSPSLFMLRESIVRELERRQWSPYRLHRHSGVSKTVVYEYLNGNREISSNALEKLCETLQLSLVRRESEVK